MFLFVFKLKGFTRGPLSAMVNKLTWLLGLTSLAVGCAMFHEIEQVRTHDPPTRTNAIVVIKSPLPEIGRRTRITPP